MAGEAARRRHRLVGGRIDDRHPVGLAALAPGIEAHALHDNAGGVGDGVGGAEMIAEQIALVVGAGGAIAGYGCG